MKLRSTIALVLSFAMTITMIPSVAFAATTNKLGSVVTVSEDSGVPSTYMEYTVKTGSEWTTTQTIAFEITNAEFQNLPLALGDGKIVNNSGNDVITLNYSDKDNTDGGAVVAKITALNSSDEDSANFTITTYSDAECTVPAPAKVNDIITITIADSALKATGDSGSNVTLELDSMDSNFTAGTYTIARILQGGTTATLKGTAKTYPEKVAFEAAEVMIKEKTMDSLEVGSLHVIKFTLPKNVKFAQAAGSYGLADISSSLFKTTALNDPVAEGTAFSEMTAGKYYTEKNDRVLYACIEIGGSASAVNSAYFKPYLKIDSDAKKGAITLSIDDMYASSGGQLTSTSGIKIANYGSEGVTVTSSSTAPTVIAGQVTDPENNFFWTKIVLTENLAGSLRQGRTINVDLPEEAQIVTAYMNDDAGIRVSFDKTKDVSYGEKAKLIDVEGLPAGTRSEVSVNTGGGRVYMTSEYDHGYTLADDTSGFCVTVPEPNMDASKKWDEVTANTLIIFVPITVRADYTGEIKAEVSGRDFDTTTVTIAKAVAPLTITTQVTDVVNGMQDQKLADITIEEAAPGYIGKTAAADKLAINVDNAGILNLFALDKAKVEVTAGDIGIEDKLDYDADGNIIVTVIGSSIYKSTIKISGIVMTTSRLLPEGSYDVCAIVDPDYSAGLANAGSVVATDTLSVPDTDAVIENGQFDKGNFGVSSKLKYCATPYMKLVTAADTVQGGTTGAFFLNSAKASTYTVNGVTYEMDAAAFIDENNRTMVPIRYVAYALGLSEADISYDVSAATATISGLTNVVKVTTGSSVLRCSNSADVQMDTAAVNYNNRLYVPARFIAQAMGAQVSWDQTTQTVTITQ